MPNSNKINKIIEMYNLEPHIEGGYYKRYYESENYVIKDNQEQCKSGSAIYYLLTKKDYSRFHSISSDEIWHYYSGGILEIHEINIHGQYNIHYLGDKLKYSHAEFSICMKKGSIFAAKLHKGSYILAGCSLHPEFIMKDFRLYSYDEIIQLYPKYITHINKFYNK